MLEKLLVESKVTSGEVASFFPVSERNSLDLEDPDDRLDFMRFGAAGVMSA